MTAANLLEVAGLRVTLGAGTVLRGVDFAIRPGEALGLVGESGSGKSMTARANVPSDRAPRCSPARGCCSPTSPRPRST